MQENYSDGRKKTKKEKTKERKKGNVITKDSWRNSAYDKWKAKKEESNQKVRTQKKENKKEVKQGEKKGNISFKEQLVIVLLSLHLRATEIVICNCLSLCACLCNGVFSLNSLYVHERMNRLINGVVSCQYHITQSLPSDSSFSIKGIHALNITLTYITGVHSLNKFDLKCISKNVKRIRK